MKNVTYDYAEKITQKMAEKGKDVVKYEDEWYKLDREGRLKILDDTKWKGCIRKGV